VTKSNAAPKAALAELLRPVVERFGADLEDVSISRAGSRSVVRVVVDRDGGLDLDGVAEVSQAVSTELDGEEAGALLRGSFVLEVTTPGVDRPLTEPRHWRRARGRLVAVTRRSGGPLLARVRSADDDRVRLAGEGLPGGEVDVPYAEVTRAVVQVEFHAPDDRPDEVPDAALTPEVNPR
jgi:ribosome maturation factor RimP